MRTCTVEPFRSVSLRHMTGPARVRRPPFAIEFNAVPRDSQSHLIATGACILHEWHRTATRCPCLRNTSASAQLLFAQAAINWFGKFNDGRVSKHFFAQAAICQFSLQTHKE